MDVFIGSTRRSVRLLHFVRNGLARCIVQSNTSQKWVLANVSLLHALRGHVSRPTVFILCGESGCSQLLHCFIVSKVMFPVLLLFILLGENGRSQLCVIVSLVYSLVCNHPVCYTMW